MFNYKKSSYRTVNVAILETHIGQNSSKMYKKQEQNLSIH